MVKDEQSGKYAINAEFNQEGAASVSFLPTADELLATDEARVAAFNFQELSARADAALGTAEGTTASAAQTKFAETLKFRIDARVIKHLKHQKKMKLDELIDLVMVELQMQVHIHMNHDQLKERRDIILKRIDDLQERVYLKKDAEIVEYVPV